MLEWAVVHSNFFAVDPISPFIKDFPKMVSMGKFHIDEVHLAIEPQRLYAPLIQAILSSFRLFEHDQRSTGDDIVSVQERTASSKSIDEIKFELIASRVSP